MSSTERDKDVHEVARFPTTYPIITKTELKKVKGSGEIIVAGIVKCYQILGLAVLGFIYILSPIDFIPDFIPILGWVDDIGVAGWLIKTLISKVARHIALWVWIIPGGLFFCIGIWIGWLHIGAITGGLAMLFGLWKVGRDFEVWES